MAERSLKFPAVGNRQLPQGPRDQEALKALKDIWDQHSELWDDDTKQEIIQHVFNGATKVTKSNARKPSKHKLWEEYEITFAIWVIFRALYDVRTLSVRAKARLVDKYPEIDPWSWVSPSFNVKGKDHNGKGNEEDEEGDEDEEDGDDEDDEDFKVKTEKADSQATLGRNMLQVVATPIPDHHHFSVQIYRYRKKGDILKRKLPDTFDERFQKVQKTEPGAVGSLANPRYFPKYTTSENDSTSNLRITSLGPSHRSSFQGIINHKNLSHNSHNRSKITPRTPNFAEYASASRGGLSTSIFGKQIKVRESIETHEPVSNLPTDPEADVKADAKTTSPINLPPIPRQTSLTFGENPTVPDHHQVNQVAANNLHLNPFIQALSEYRLQPDKINPQIMDSQPEVHYPDAQIDISQTHDNGDLRQQFSELQGVAHSLGLLADDLKARVSRALESFKDNN